VNVLIVDGANVVGSRPDGWWRDRAGAAHRLYERLSVADLPFDQVVLVLEGAARKGVDASDGPVGLVHALGQGDDAVVALARMQASDGWEVTVVTADRGLRERVTEEACAVLGPTWLLDQVG
jgi:hypothetical protein